MDGVVSKRLVQLAERVLDLRWVIIGLFMCIAAVSAWLIVTELKADSSTEYFASGDEELSTKLKGFREDFGRDDLFFVVVEGDVFSEPFLASLGELHDALESVDIELESAGERPEDRLAEKLGEVESTETQGALDDFGDFGDDDGWGDESGGSVVEEVTSLVNFRLTDGSGGSVRVRGLLDEAPSDLDTLRKQVLQNPALVGNLVGESGAHTALSVRLQFMNEQDTDRMHLELTELVSTFEREGFAPTVTGVPALNADLNRIIQRDTQVLIVLASVVMLIVLTILFRRPSLVLVPCIVVLLSGLFALAFMAALGSPVTILTSIIPAFLACVGLGDSIHIQTVYRDELREGHGHRKALVYALASTAIPVAFTSMTTMAGLLSFQLSRTIAIREMGLAGAVGVGMAWFASSLLLPALLSFFRPTFEPVEGASGDWIDRLLGGATSLSTGARKWGVLGAAVGLIAAVGVGVSKVEVYHNPLSWMGSQHPTTLAVMKMDEHVGGVSSVAVVVDAPEGKTVADLSLLRGLESLSEKLKTYRHPVSGDAIVTGTVSLVDVVKETNRALHGGDEAFYALPETQRAASDALMLFENAGPDQLSQLVTGDLKRTHLTIRVKWTDASSYGPFTEFIDAQVAETLPDGFRVVTTGSVYSLLSVVEALITDMIRSFGAAVCAVTLMMILLFRDLKLGLLSMVPNLLPIGMVLAVMGFAGVQINTSNLLVASIVIGIAVDDTVHYLYQFRKGYRAGNGVEAAIERSVSHAGRALVITSIVLVTGFLVFTASRLETSRSFGALVALACVFALFADLILAPALLRAAYKGESHA